MLQSTYVQLPCYRPQEGLARVRVRVRVKVIGEGAEAEARGWGVVGWGGGGYHRGFCTLHTPVFCFFFLSFFFFLFRFANCWAVIGLIKSALFFFKFFFFTP